METFIYEIINEEMIKISFGQGMDIYWHKKNSEDVTEEHYLQMCAYKTGTLARIAAKLGAILGSGNPDQVNYLVKFAESIGVGFQIQDDILNLTNNDWGKDFGEDITEGKMTLMVIKTLKDASIEDRKRLLEILKLKTKDLNLINKTVMLKRKENYSKQRGDRYLLMPVLRDLESFNFSNTKDFFVQDGVKDFELNEKDYCIYLENLYKNYENSLRKDLFLE